MFESQGNGQLELQYKDVGGADTTSTFLDAASRFNKRREDFKSLKDYNDYLETVEDLSKADQIF